MLAAASSLSNHDSLGIASETTPKWLLDTLLACQELEPLQDNWARRVTVGFACISGIPVGGQRWHRLLGTSEPGIESGPADLYADAASPRRRRARARRPVARFRATAHPRRCGLNRKLAPASRATQHDPNPLDLRVPVLRLEAILVGRDAASCRRWLPG